MRIRKAKFHSIQFWRQSPRNKMALISVIEAKKAEYSPAVGKKR
jgi:hypothetical protein